MRRAVVARWSSPVGSLKVEHVPHILKLASSIDADQEVQGTLVVIMPTINE